MREIMVHDEQVSVPSGNAVPSGDTNAILVETRDLFRTLHPELGRFATVLVDNGLLDVEARDGKVAGASCVFLPTIGLPFIFAHFNGTESDVQSLLHECGHAFHMYSCRSAPLLEYVCGTSDVSEFCAIGMEMITFSEVERYFGSQASKFRAAYLERETLRLPFLALLEHFQTELYSLSEITTAQVNEIWLDLEQKYLPWRSYGNLFPHLSAGFYWQLVPHIFNYPFLAIEYVFARMPALDLLRRCQEDREQAIDDYVQMCGLGGSRSFSELLAQGAIASPFDRDAMSRTINHLERGLLERG
jgi:M3 family oligoendopeptidase